MFRPSSFRALSIVGLMLLLHLPFMLADPDTEVSLLSRGPWTDEGLNTVQVRNFVNHGDLSVSECDNLIKTPIFGAILVPFYTLLGTELWVGRAVVSGFVLAVLFLLLSYRATRSFAIAFAGLGLMQFHLFHYAHYSMAEMMGVSFILLGILLFRSAYDNEQRIWFIGAALAMGLAFLSKVTFAYVLFIPLLARFFMFLNERVRKRDSIGSLVVDSGIIAFVVASVASAFYYLWYRPNKAVFDLVKADQGNDRFDLVTAWQRAEFNWTNFVAIEGMAPFFLLLLIAIVFVVRTSSRSKGDSAMLFGLVAWLVLESHRMLLVNPPSRYLVPLFAAVLALTAFGITQWKESDARRVIGICLIFGFTVYNFTFYRQSLQRKTSTMQEISEYLASKDLRDHTVLGAWATGLAAKSGAYTLPVWNGFMNYEDALHRYHPRAVITEFDEAESSGAFQAQGIDLRVVSDSVRAFDIWRYKVNVYWIRQDFGPHSDKQ